MNLFCSTCLRLVKSFSKKTYAETIDRRSNLILELLKRQLQKGEKTLLIVEHLIGTAETNLFVQLVFGWQNRLQKKR